MSYKVSLADLNSLRYLHAFYAYLEYDIKLNQKVRDSLRGEVKALFNKYSAEVIKVASRDDMLRGFEDLVEEFQEDVKKEPRPLRKPKKNDGDKF